MRERVENFDFHRDCPFSYPKVLPGALSENFDCDAAFHPTSTMEFGHDENMRPNEALDELIQFFVKSIHNCGHLDDYYISHYGDNYEWYTEVDYPYYEIYYYDYEHGKPSFPFKISSNLLKFLSNPPKLTPNLI